MSKIIIDKEKCVGCGLCKSDCVAFAIDVKNGKAEMNGMCIECGHCYAICPTNAIDMADYDTKNELVTPMTDIDSDLLLSAMKSRRTVRQFKDQPIEQEKIDKILEAGRYCPTGGNSQNVAYTILEDKRDDLEKECVKLFRTGIKAGSSFVKSLKRMNIDDQFFFKGAPLVIVVSGKDDVNASLASSYMELMAESMGIGVLYSGFFVSCSKINPKIKKMLNLRKGFKPVTCMIFGYPKIEYKRIVPRKDLKIDKV